MNLSPKRRDELRKRIYLIAEANEMTQQSLAEYYTRRVEGELNATTIQYGKKNQKVQGYLVEFTAVEYMIDANRNDPKFVFVAYYQNPGADDRWFKLKTEQKTPSQQIHIAVMGGGLSTKPKIKLGAMMEKHRKHA